MTLEEEGLRDFADVWEEANDLDYELYAFARSVAREQLEAAGVRVAGAASLPKVRPPCRTHASALTLIASSVSRFEGRRACALPRLHVAACLPCLGCGVACVCCHLRCVSRCLA